MARKAKEPVGDSMFPSLCVAAGLSRPVPEYRFHPTRKWRFDWAWPDFKIALEIEGGVWTGGRHIRGSGFVKDIEKYNEAAIANWKVIRVTTKMFNSGDALVLVSRAADAA